MSKRLIVHVHSASGISFIRKSLLLAIARRLGCVTIFHLHGAEFDTYATERSGCVIQWWIRRTFEKTTQVIVLSNEWAKFVTAYAPQAKITVLPNSVALFDRSEPAIEENYRILFLGYIELRKGIFDLMVAIMQLKQIFPAVKLVVAGDGDVEKMCILAEELGISGQIELLGWIGGAQKRQELHRASVFVLPSHAEGLPMALLEAMSASKAVVVTSVGGMPSAVQHDVNGLLVPPHDVTALAEALARLLGNPALRERLAANARKSIEQRYSHACVLGQLSCLYNALNGGH